MGLGRKAIRPYAVSANTASQPSWLNDDDETRAALKVLRVLRVAPLIGRLRKLSAKEFALLGLGVAMLVLAPVFEYALSHSGDERSEAGVGPGLDATMGVFEPGSPFESGVAGIAPGGIPGRGEGIVTPLTASHPSLLLLSDFEIPAGTQQPHPAAAAAAVAPTSPGETSEWKNALAAARSGAGNAARRKGLPRPDKKLSGALADWRKSSPAPSPSAAGGLALAAPTDSTLPSRPRQSNSLAPSSRTSDYRGPASGAGARPGFLDPSLEAQTQKAGRFFDRAQGENSTPLTRDEISDETRSASAGPSALFDRRDNDPSASKQDALNRAQRGESLATLRAKLEMAKAVELKWAKKEYRELGRQKMVEQVVVQTASQAFMTALGAVIGNVFGGG